jgi:hypothetical protein
MNPTGRVPLKSEAPDVSVSAIFAKIYYWPVSAHIGINLKGHWINSVLVICQEVQRRGRHRVVLRQLLWVHHAQQYRERFLHVLRYCIVVDRNRHDIDETVQRKWSEGVGNAVIYCKLIAALVWI